MNIDLHIHSSFSDGAFTPLELVQRALKQNVSVIAIADHDSVAGISSAHIAGVESGVEVLSAVELSTQFRNFEDVHLLGYGIDYRDELFMNNLNGFRSRRAGRNDEILLRVNSLLLSEGRVALDNDRVKSFAHGSLGRPHIARALLEKGYAINVEDAFRKFLVPCNVPKSYWAIADAIIEIHRIGGAAVLAHPTSISKDMNMLSSIISDLKNLGLDGIEVYNNMGWPLEIEFLRRTAIELDLIMTAGSDFHGIEEGLEIGKGRDGICFNGNLLPPLYKQIAKYS